VKAFDQIKEKIGRSVLKKTMKSHERNKVFHNFNTARSVGLLFDATDHQNYETARSFAKFLTEKKMRIYGLGFADSKEVMNFYQYYTGFHFFTLKDSNWKSIPSNHNVNDFINEKMDILIDLHQTENFQLEYINAMSQAAFKIGPYSADSKNYDFMIDISSNPTADFLCEQIKHYLSIINNH
jgi:DNA-directed RNA polymerase